ncbi:MAG: hypothetical protein ACI8XO_002627, partial [Verrucomicrobiales bacterium]
DLEGIVLKWAFHFGKVGLVRGIAAAIYFGIKSAAAAS